MILFPEIYCGDAIEKLRLFRDKSVQCVVTSPPYFGLRDYGTARWEGGDPACGHVVVGAERTRWANSIPGPAGATAKNARGRNETKEQGGSCGKCGAQRIDAQIGLEKTPDAYVAKLVEVFREVWRVLRDDGTCWVVIGDSYNNFHAEMGPGQAVHGRDKMNGKPEIKSRRRGTAGLKEKDLIGIPWMVAFALRDAGWYLRSAITWTKPNPMPESIRDRPTSSYEMIFMLTKKASYFYDHEAIKEPSVSDHPSGNSFKRSPRLTYSDKNGARGNEEQWTDVGGKRNARNVWTITDDRKALAGPTYERHRSAIPGGQSLQVEPDGQRNARNVWTITTKPYKGAHFATMPIELAERCIKAGTSEHLTSVKRLKVNPTLPGCSEVAATPPAPTPDSRPRTTRLTVCRTPPT